MIPTNRIRLALAATVAVLAVPAVALAGPNDGRSADTIDAASAAQQASVIPSDGRSADTLDAVYEVHQTSLVPSDGRSPDTREAASAPRPVVFTVPGGFDWADAGVGAGFAGGFLIVGAGLGAIWLYRHPRRPIQTP